MHAFLLGKHHCLLCAAGLCEQYVSRDVCNIHASLELLCSAFIPCTGLNRCTSRRTAREARGLHRKGVGLIGPARGVLAGCVAEGMEAGAEHKIVPLAQRNAQATQGFFDLR